MPEQQDIISEMPPDTPPSSDAAAPADLPTDDERFWSVGPEFDSLKAPVPPETSALQRLGPSPFPKGKFPFLGFLASVYEHVAQVVKQTGKV